MFDEDPRLSPEKVSQAKIVENPPPPKPSPPVVKLDKPPKIESKPKPKVGKRKQYKNRGDAPKVRMHQRSEYDRRFVLRVNIDNRLKGQSNSILTPCFPQPPQWRLVNTLSSSIVRVQEEAGIFLLNFISVLSNLG